MAKELTKEEKDKLIETQQKEITDLKKVIINTHDIMKTFRDERAYEYLTHKIQDLDIKL